MTFLNGLFADNKVMTLGAAIAAFLVFAVLILLFVRLLFGNRLRMGGGRGRQQRLGVVDAYDMDRQRQLVLVRRDNTEHLILIGGPNDLLIESAIVRVEARDGRERPPGALREPATAEPRIPVSETRAVEPAPEPVRPPPLPLPMTSIAPPPVPLPAEPPVPVAADPEPVPPVAPMPDAAVREPRLPDLFARIRANRAAPPSMEPPPVPEPPPVQEPPPADADFFETEIAKALAPSMRERTVAPPSAPPVEDEVRTEPVKERAREVETAAEPTTSPQRPPFRPFPRREPTVAPPVATGDRPAPTIRAPSVRPPPPPFFSRMAQRGKDREQAGETPPPAVPVQEAHPESPPKPISQEPVTLFPEPDRGTTTPLDVSTPSSEPVAPIAEPEPAIREETASAPASPPTIPQDPPHAADPVTPPPIKASEESENPFEEEMARLLGRSGSKDG